MRFRFLGAKTQEIKIAGGCSIPVTPGDTFEIPDKWAYALGTRGIKVEEVGDEPAAGEPTEGSELVAEAPTEDAPPAAGRRRRR